ncbi:hypothetical protein OEZ85_002004 [Tetradesmus obliquus]|uniref:CRAL-TRIO domain-containing protein n=1 Tax=Tetradesmus obliquus TaxID=3088 RepID=A0ABY8U1L2_TETOB|nr:hypothetical protein OEZ85_002004 [Tetradesmus obliquus]
MFSKNTSAVHKTYVDIDHEHTSALLAFKARLAEAGLQIPRELVVNGDLDATLYRFLRARKYNVQLAYAMLEKSLAWRAAKGADTILEQPMDPHFTSVVRQCRPSSYIGYDKEHHPIFLERLGQLDGRRMEREGATDDVILAYHLREMEFMSQVVLPEASAAAGHTQDRIVSIMDAAGLSLSSLTGFAQRLFRLISAMDSDNFPECCHAIYIANAGAAFSAVWKLLAPFVDKGTRDKVHVLGGARASQAALLDAFGAHTLPTFLGGQMDYETVRQQWLDKMDAAIAQRQQHPRGKQPPLMLQAVNGQLPHLQQPQHAQRSSGSGSWLPKLHLGHGPASSTSGAGDRVSSADEGGWATPLSTASKFSVISGASVYFDAQDSAPGSPSGVSPASSDHGELHHPAAAAAAAHGASPLQHGSHADGTGQLWGPGSVLSGSMSVGPQSRSRSQLSQHSGLTGFTGHAGAGGAYAGAGSVDGGPGGLGLEEGEGLEAGGSVNGQALLEGEGPAGEGKQPLCRCVIS